MFGIINHLYWAGTGKQNDRKTFKIAQQGRLSFSKAHNLFMSLGAFRKLLSLLFHNKDDEIITLSLL